MNNLTTRSALSQEKYFLAIPDLVSRLNDHLQR